MGDSYRDEIKVKKQSLGKNTQSLPYGRPRTLEEERRALRRDYFAALSKRAAKPLAAQRRLLDVDA